MPTVFWYPLGFSVVESLTKGWHFDAQCFTSTILSAIAENRPMQTWEGQNRKIVLYFNNARSHTARSTIGYINRNYLVQAVHRTVSPDLAPSDSYLFGKVKAVLMGATFEDED
jgi:hypothetical protein